MLGCYPKSSTLLSVHGANTQRAQPFPHGSKTRAPPSARQRRDSRGRPRLRTPPAACRAEPCCAMPAAALRGHLQTARCSAVASAAQPSSAAAAASSFSAVGLQTQPPTTARGSEEEGAGAQLPPPHARRGPYAVRCGSNQERSRWKRVTACRPAGRCRERGVLGWAGSRPASLILEKQRVKLGAGTFVRGGRVSVSSVEGQDAKSRVLTALTCGFCNGEWLRVIRKQYA